jgi:uncharacterized protein RhaS with RHS repeats
LYYFNARWYDPELGRFVSEDPLRDSANWYVYVGNSPLTNTDATGTTIQRVPRTPHQQDAAETVMLGLGDRSIRDVGCVLAAVVRIAEAIGKKEISL